MLSCSALIIDRVALRTSFLTLLKLSKVPIPLVLIHFFHALDFYFTRFLILSGYGRHHFLPGGHLKTFTVGMNLRELLIIISLNTFHSDSTSLAYGSNVESQSMSREF